MLSVLLKVDSLSFLKRKMMSVRLISRVVLLVYSVFGLRLCFLICRMFYGV